MWPISAQFKKALGYGPSFRTLCTVTPPGGAALVLDMVSGSVSVDAVARIRRRVDSFSVRGGAAVFEQLATPGAVLRISHGIQFRTSADPELVPVFTGEVSAPRLTVGSGLVTLGGLDLANWLSRTTYDAPYTVAAATSRVTAITTAVQAARPGTAVVNESTDVGTVPTQMVWTTGPLDLIADLTKAGNTEGFFRPDGTFLIRDLPSSASKSVWDVSAGPGGTLKTADRVRSTDRMFNRVSVEPSARDGSQTWAPQVAEITDASHPLHKSKIGTSTKKIQSPVATQAEASAIAQRTLALATTGQAETLSLGAIENPALEGYDVIRVATARVNGDPAGLYQHFIDTMSLDLVSHSMTLGTLSQVVTD